MKKKVLTLLVLLTILTPLFAFDFFATLDDEQGAFTTESVPLKELTSLYVEGFGTYYPLDDDDSFGWGISLGVSFEENRERIRTEVDFSFSPILRDPLSVNTLAVTFFFGPTNLKVGMFTHPWGTTTTLHSVDILNAQDVSQGILDDPEAMKKSEFMIVYNAYFKNSSLDLIVKPFYRPMEFDEDDRFFPMDTSNLLGDKYVFEGMPIDIVIDDGVLEKVAGSYKHPNFWKALGGGGRYRFGVGDLDLGFMYFTGYYPQTGFDIGAKISFPPPQLTIESIKLDLTRYHFAGTEGTLFAGPLSIAWEGGFFLSEDLKNENPAKYNTKASAVVEVSYTEPKTSFFASVAYQGQYIFDYEEPLIADPSIFGSAGTSPLIIPVDYLSSFFSDNPYSSSVAVAFELPLMRERLRLRAAATYGIENQGLVALGSLSYEISDALSVYARGAYYDGFGDKESLFKSWAKNSSVTVGMKAWF